MPSFTELPQSAAAASTTKAFDSEASSSNYTPVSGNPFELGLVEDGTENGAWEAEAAGVRSEKRFYEVGYYATYFDVELHEVLWRLGKSLVPVARLFEEGDGGGDLYGPFWVTATAVLCLSVGREVGGFLRGMVKGEEFVRSGEFRRIWVGAGVLYGYVLVFPIVLLACQCLFARETLEGARRGGGGAFLGTVAVYGYAMTPVVVASVVAAIPIKLVQLIAMGVAFVVGAWVIVLNLWRDVPVERSSLAYLIRLVAGLAHAAVGSAIISLFYLQGE